MSVSPLGPQLHWFQIDELVDDLKALGGVTSCRCKALGLPYWCSCAASEGLNPSTSKNSHSMARHEIRLLRVVNIALYVPRCPRLDIALRVAWSRYRYRRRRWLGGWRWMGGRRGPHQSTQPPAAATCEAFCWLGGCDCGLSLHQVSEISDATHMVDATA